MKYSAIVEAAELSYLERFGITSIVAAIGVFDGIHLGHRAIIERLLAAAKEAGAAPVVITFSPHPRHFLIQESSLKLLRSQESKAELLGKLGIKAVVTINFTEKISMMTPDEFVNYLLSNKNIKLNTICVGRNWKFGAGAKGDIKLFEQLAQKKGFKLYPVEQVFLDGIPVSSTRIRKELTSAKFDIAYKMLGCAYKMEGKIIKSLSETKCIIEYGIVPHHPGEYECELFIGSKAIVIDALVDKQGIRENSFFIKDTEGLSKLKNGESVEIFFKP